MMNSATVDDGDFPPNPFRSPPQQQQQQQQQPYQHHQQQQQDFFSTPTPTQAPASDPLYGAGAPTFAQPPPVASGPTNAYAMQQQPMQQMMAPAPLPTGAMDANAQTRAVPAGGGDGQQAAVAPRQTCWQACTSCFSMDTYKSYFDIDTEDIVKRLQSALFHFYLPDKFRTETIGVQRDENHKGPDLYGPLWITMTLVFFMALSSNMSAYLRASSSQEFEYDIYHLAHALTVLFFFVFVIPAAFWFMTQLLGMQALQMVDWICLYGYSMVPYLPASVLCLVPFHLWIWIVLALATVISVLLIIRNVAAPLLGTDAQGNKTAPILIAILVDHLVLFFVLKLLFYK